MKTHTHIRLFFAGLLAALLAAALPASADISHARIVRLSLVQGDVRFTRSAGNDPLTNTKAMWETAIVNLPIQQGYVLSTGSGRAEVEFESGAAAWLDENSMLEFYEMSLNDGARITQLVLRQGTAAFYVNPSRGDVFSVTGGDFTAVADGRASFRINNFDDGSSVQVDKGRVSVQTKTETITVSKGQSLTLQAAENAAPVTGALPVSDEFDKWVAGRAETVMTATNSALQYVSSPYYSAGFADLYTYGSWFNYAGYGFCWRPIGAGFGWSPFSMGEWAFVPGIGWTWVSFEPWGWLPYHFGGWLFSPAYGWVWVPNGIGLGTGRYWRPVTAVWVRSGSSVGLVPVHPMDARGKTPLNLTHGFLRPPGVGDAGPTRVAVDPDAKVKVLRKPPEGVISSRPAAATPPSRVSRMLLAGDAGARAVTVGRESSIVYDGRERKFVNANSSPPRPSEGITGLGGDAKSAGLAREPGAAGAGANASGGRSPATVVMPNRVMPPAVRVSPPPRVSSGGGFWSSIGGRSSGGSSATGARVGGGGSSSGGGSARGSSGGSGGGGRSSGGSSGSSRPSGGGRPH